jgi:tetratricopeptide (TPR) repeat protein
MPLFLGSRDVARLASVSLSATLLLAHPHLACAQKAQPEFTRQALLIANFAHDTVGDRKLGRKAADAVRSRIAKLVNKRETDIIGPDAVSFELEKGGYDPYMTPTIGELRLLGRTLRADEYLMGTVRRIDGKYRLSGDLILVRDVKQHQPLPEAVGATLDDAAEQFARSAAAARGQLVPQRRCENALREGKGSEAVSQARAGVNAYAQSTLARTCLVWALRSTHAPAGEVLSVSQQVLAVDSLNPHAIEGAAVAFDSLRRRDDAARMWVRLFATDTANIELAQRIANALIDGANTRTAESFLLPLVAAHPDSLTLVRLEWRAAFENKSWDNAIKAGEMLLAADDFARRDSTFHVRLATAYHANNAPYKAVETLSRAVPLFPGDARLYALYTQYVRAEADTAIPRGLALFPKNGQLLAMQARDLRTRGKLQESLDAARQAVTLDSTLSQGQLMVAQVEMELGHPDSALASLHRALDQGEDTAVVAQFALAKGNSLYRAAGGTHTSGDFSLALHFLALADSLRTSPQSRLLLGAAALGVAQAALTEAPKLTDKVESCRLARLGAEMLPLARSALASGQEAFPEAAKQSLENAGVLDPYATQQVGAFCPAAASNPGSH